MPGTGLDAPGERAVGEMDHNFVPRPRGTIADEAFLDLHQRTAIFDTTGDECLGKRTIPVGR